MIKTLFTFDYEIFGNGTGDIINCLISPTDRITEILADHSISATFFVDVCLIWALEDNEKKGNFNHLDYLPSKLIKEHIQNLLKKGHDVQLHAHPQMIGSEFKNGVFKVNYKNWRIPDLPLGNSENLSSISGIISNGKRTLEDILIQVKPDYKCVAFRAGGLCSRPEQNLLKALRKYNFTFDFSASYNFRTDEGPGIVDFTDVFDNPYPKLIGELYTNLAKENPIVLMPIYGTKYYIWSEFVKRVLEKFAQNKSRWNFKKQRPQGCQGSTKIEGLVNKTIKKKNTSRFAPINVNFYLEYNSDSMIWCTKDAIKHSRRNSRDIFLIGLGHPKAMGDLSQLIKYLNWIFSNKYNKDLDFCTIQQISDFDFSQYME